MSLAVTEGAYSNQAFQQTNDEVLSKDIQWDNYRASGQLGDKDMAVIKRLDKTSDSARSAVLQEVRLLPVCTAAVDRTPAAGSDQL